MTPTEILSSEHRVIEQVLVCLERLIEESGAAGRLDAQVATDVLEFIREFADRCHHGKEEDQLFPAMEARGFSPQRGPTAVMRSEHDTGRAHVRAMRDAVPAAATGDASALGLFAEHGRAFVALLSQHIAKEDQILFPMADRAIDAVGQAELLERFQHVEAHHMGTGTHEKYLQLARRLCERYGVANVVPHMACHCGH